MTTTFAPGDRVVYEPYGWFATYVETDSAGMARIRWDNAEEIVVNPHTLDVWPHPVVLVPRAEVRRIYTDHGVPPWPQIEGDGVVDLICVELSARDSRELAEDSENALRLSAIADDLDQLVARYQQGAALTEATR